MRQEAKKRANKNVTIQMLLKKREVEGSPQERRGDTTPE